MPQTIKCFGCDKVVDVLPGFCRNCGFRFDSKMNEEIRPVTFVCPGCRRSRGPAGATCDACGTVFSQPIPFVKTSPMAYERAEYDKTTANINKAGNISCLFALVGLPVLIILFVVFAHFTDGPRAASTAPGNKVTLTNSSGGGVVLAVDNEAMNELAKAQIHGDTEGLGLLIVNGRAFAVPAGTQAYSVDYAGLGVAKVRIEEGENAGKEGLVPSECLHAIK